MQDMTIAAVQMNAVIGQTEENREVVIRFARQAAAQGAELVCFPELCLTGHWCAGEVWSAAEAVPDGPSCTALCQVARELGIFLSVGLAEKAAGIVYNTQVIIGPAGVVGTQRKLHMSYDEYFHYRGGGEIGVFDIGPCVLGIGICYDNNFPEVPRIAALRGAEVYLMPHAARCGEWPEDEESRCRTVANSKRYWSRVFATRALENGMFAVVCNQAGRAGTIPTANHAGGVMVFDPAGETVAESATETIEEEMVLCRLEAASFIARRQANCFYLQTRRPELFEELVRR